MARLRNLWNLLKKVGMIIIQIFRPTPHFHSMYHNNKLLLFVYLFQALVQEDPNYVVKRYESRKYAIDESVTSEYLKVQLTNYNYVILDLLLHR